MAKNNFEVRVCPKCDCDDVELFNWWKAKDKNLEGYHEWRNYVCEACSFGWIELWKFIEWKPT